MYTGARYYDLPEQGGSYSSQHLQVGQGTVTVLGGSLSAKNSAVISISQKPGSGEIYSLVFCAVMMNGLTCPDDPLNIDYKYESVVTAYAQAANHTLLYPIAEVRSNYNAPYANYFFSKWGVSADMQTIYLQMYLGFETAPTYDTTGWFVVSLGYNIVNEAAIQPIP